jgi:hypothetical protein
VADPDDAEGGDEGWVDVRGGRGRARMGWKGARGGREFRGSGGGAYGDAFCDVNDERLLERVDPGRHFVVSCFDFGEEGAHVLIIE